MQRLSKLSDLVQEQGLHKVDAADRWAQHTYHDCIQAYNFVQKKVPVVLSELEREKYGEDMPDAETLLKDRLDALEAALRKYKDSEEKEEQLVDRDSRVVNDKEAMILYNGWIKEFKELHKQCVGDSTVKQAKIDLVSNLKALHHAAKEGVKEIDVMPCQNSLNVLRLLVVEKKTEKDEKDTISKGSKQQGSKRSKCEDCEQRREIFNDGVCFECFSVDECTHIAEDLGYRMDKLQDESIYNQVVDDYNSFAETMQDILDKKKTMTKKVYKQLMDIAVSISDKLPDDDDSDPNYADQKEDEEEEEEDDDDSPKDVFLGVEAMDEGLDEDEIGGGASGHGLVRQVKQLRMAVFGRSSTDPLGADGDYAVLDPRTMQVGDTRYPTFKKARIAASEDKNRVIYLFE